MPRKKSNSAKVNLIISAVVHAVVFGALTFWAAHEGVLGKQLKELTAVLVPPEKKELPPEKPPEKPPEPKIEEPKPEEVPVAPKMVEAPVDKGPAPAVEAPAAVAPAAIIASDFSFSDGAKAVETGTNAPMVFYKNLMEYSFRASWERPKDVADDNFAADIEIAVDGQGRILDSKIVKGSGNKRWDDSVRKAVAGTKKLSRPPPKDFPMRFIVRFDVQPPSADAFGLNDGTQQF